MDSTPARGRLTDHLAIGVLTGLIHRDIVDDVIRECGKREKRSRLLPAHVVMYYVLALNLFFGEAYEEVMRQLVNGLKFLGNWRDNWEVPSTSAISQARTRLGEAPMKLLFERIAVPMAQAAPLSLIESISINIVLAMSQITAPPINQASTIVAVSCHRLRR